MRVLSTAATAALLASGTVAISRDGSIGGALKGAHATVCSWADQRAQELLGAASELTAAVGSSALAVGGRAGLLQHRRGASSAGGGRYGAADISRVTDRVVASVISAVRSKGWEHVATQQGVTVWRHRSAGAGSGYACIKAAAVIDAPCDVVYRLFADSTMMSRVREYNDHCRELCDLEVLDASTKITWTASGRMGPFKARDFCSLVHLRTLDDGTRAQVSRPARHPGAPPCDRYVRSEVLLAGNFMRPLPSDPSKTEFLSLSQLNLGGAAESRAGAMLVNNLAASGPVTFVRKLEAAAQRLSREIDDEKRRRRDSGSGGGGGGGLFGGVAPAPYEDREVTRRLPIV